MRVTSLLRSSLLPQLNRTFDLLPKNAKRKSGIYFLAQLLANLMDIVGLILIGLLLALSITGIQSRDAGSAVSRVTEILKIDGLTLAGQATFLGGLAMGFFLGKTFFSIWLSRKTLRMLSVTSAKLSAEYSDRLLNSGYKEISKHSIQKYQFDILSGMNALILEGLGGTLAFLVDTALIIFIFTALILVDPFVAFVALIIFFSLGLLLYSIMGERLKKIGERTTQLSILGSEDIQQTINVYKEVSLRGTRVFFVDKITRTRMSLAELSWKSAFYPTISKYIFESAVIISAIFVAGLAFLLNDAVNAASTLTIFMTAASRMAPASLRMQQNAVSIKNSMGRGTESLVALEELRERERDFQPNLKITRLASSGISLNQVTFSHDNETLEPTILNVTLQFDEGKFVAIVGPTGSGKSTIMNLIGGFLEPTSGFVHINGLSPSEYVESGPGLIGYVPQNIFVINGSLYDNIALGVEQTPETIEACLDALKSAHLWDFVESLPGGINTIIKGPMGGLSGGQLQRLGIARCLFSKPRIVLLDEATSSLDAGTEVLVSKEIIRNLNGATLVVIAHRLSTIKEADEIFYLDKGILIGNGSFDELRSQVPNFESQATLLGL